MNFKAKIAKTIVMASTVSLLAMPAMAGYGPGDGTGNGGVGPKDGTGNGAKKGTCIKMIDFSRGAGYMAQGGNGSANRLRNGNGGGGGYGPGDGSGNGGSGPKDGTGNGAKTGTCINS